MEKKYAPFREIISSGTNVEFVGRRKISGLISLILVLSCIAVLFINKSIHGSMLNWTIDFKGGTEIIFDFDTNVSVGTVRDALTNEGFEGIEVSAFDWHDSDGKKTKGIRVRTPEYGVITEKTSQAHSAAFKKAFSDRGIVKISWSGDTLEVRSRKNVTLMEAAEFFKNHGLRLKTGDLAIEETGEIDPATGEYRVQLGFYGLEDRYKEAIERQLKTTKATIIQTYAVGAKAGKQLRDDGIKSLFYTMILIMLYLVYRFDIRYAPGAVIALFHDAILVVGVFAVTWTDFSLTTVAAILTVIGYSVNDTVVVFDRIRENTGRLKDKTFDRVINVSLNETLSRTLLTSLTLFVVTLMMNVLGTGLVRNFAFAMNIGVIVGVYSSVFVASPCVLWIHNQFFIRKNIKH